MSFPSLLDIGIGLASGWMAEDKFGRNLAVGTEYQPVAVGGSYRTPQVSGATRLRVRAGNLNDTAAGTGARAITVYGMDANGDWINEEIATAGASAGPYTTKTFIRVFRAFVTQSGTYATELIGSHAADIVIEDEAANACATISADGFPRGQSQIAAVTVPRNYEMFITNSIITIESTKVVSVALFQRAGVLETTAPYQAMRIVEEFTGLTSQLVHVHAETIGPIAQLTDVGYMAKTTAQTADVSISFGYIMRRID